MTPDQKVGGLMTLGLSGAILTPHVRQCIEKYHCSGFRATPSIKRFGSYVNPKDKSVVVKLTNTSGYKPNAGHYGPEPTRTSFRDFLIKLQKLAAARPGGIPLHFSLDQEGGAGDEISFGDTPVFPNPMGQAATGDPELVYEIALAKARILRSVGVNWTHCPVVDINVNPANPEISVRSFSDKVDDVVMYARETCLGAQEGGLITCGKHFPGRGDSPMDAHFEIPVLDIPKETLWERELKPYRILIDEGIMPTIMLAHSIYPAIDPDDVSTVSKKLITGLLREEMHFEGVITTDSMTMAGIASRYGVPQACAMSLAAGSDLVLMKADNELVDLTFAEIKKYVDEGKISEQDLDDKLYRNLSMKYEYGLFHWGSKWDETPDEVCRDPQVIAVSEAAARRCTIVPRDRKNNLPIAPSDSLLVIEQQQVRPANANNHSIQLYEKILERAPYARLLEIGGTIDEDDTRRIAETAGDYDTIVVTNFYSRGSVPNTDTLSRELFAKFPDKKIILITNTPYSLSIPNEANAVIVSFGFGPEQREAAIRVLFGEVHPEGVWPLAWKLPE